MIITLNLFGGGFSPLSNLNIKLPSFTVLARKERKELLRPSYTAFHPVADINYDPFSDLLGTSTIF
jgi:hypothetical protein